MASRDPRIDAYIRKSAPFARPILTHLRKVVHEGCPGVEETIKWSFPHFTYHGILCAIAAFKQHCTFAISKAALLGDEGLGRRPKEAMGHFGRITSLADLPPERTLVRIVKKAAALNEQGVRAPRPKRAPRPPLKMPADFHAALGKNKKALATYEAFSPSHQREYLEWITEAKGEDTRRRRIETALGWIAEGKPRNWKYMKR
jgi:uncharacterized protein YdeI (YjbR/CyaY-like superfamily)